MNNKELTQEWLCQNYVYVDGHLFTNINGIHTQKDRLNPSMGYSVVFIKGKSYLTHRIIFLMFKGYLPKQLDHKDCNKLNNKIDNLREATPSQNQWNQRTYANNRTGVKGVGFHKKTNKFRARCQIYGKQYHLGVFDTVEQAQKVVENFRTQQHGNYARHG